MGDTTRDNISRADLDYAHSLMKEHAKSFYFASKFLPRKKRTASYAVYAFCRYADNIIDTPRQRAASELLGELESLRAELKLAYKYGESQNPVISAFIAAAKEFGIPEEYPLDLIKGVKMDLEKTRYETFGDLYVFCYRVASTVGLMMTHILGFEKEEALKYAEKLGIAMQLTNILRDIKEDKDMGRVYLPMDELKAAGLEENDIFSENFGAKFTVFMKQQVERAHKYYEDANPGIEMLDKNSRFAIYAASNIYRGILRKIEAQGYNPFAGRAFVPKSKKISILAAQYLKQKAPL